MHIDATRYSLFWANPERFRIRQLWKLTPIEPKTGMAALFTYGRKRGSCFHELMDAAYRGVPESVAVQSLRDGGFEDRPIESARRCAAEVQKRYAGLEMLAHEQLFELPIPGTPHIMTGRIDHICRRDGYLWVGDYKTMRRFSKKDTAEKVAAYCASAQVGFYLSAAQAMGFVTPDFLYRVVIDDTKKKLVEVQEHFTHRTGIELRAFQRSVAMTCDLIEWLVATYGIEQSWPNMHEKFDRGYQAIAGNRLYEGYVPDGFEPATEFLETMEDEPEETCEG